MIIVSFCATGSAWQSAGVGIGGGNVVQCAGSGNGCKSCPPTVTSAPAAALAVPPTLVVPSVNFSVLKAKPVPVIVIWVPLEPALGVMPFTEMVGGGDGLKVKAAGSVALLPSGLVTVTSTV